MSLLPPLRNSRVVKPLMHVVLMLTALLASNKAVAGPWVAADNWQVRHHLSSLVDSGAIDTPMTTWPVTWQAISKGLEDIDSRVLNDNQIISYHFLKRELQRSFEGLQIKQHTHIASSRAALQGYGHTGRDEIENGLAVDILTDHFALNIQGTYIQDPADGDKAIGDGSYLAGIWGNWALGVGAIDRWWSPGWQNSLILSNTARPSPGLFIQRNSPEPFSSPLLSWLGPWQLTTFLNQLESSRDIPSAKFWGLRTSFRPLPSVEIGFSRVAIFGGKGRSESPDTFVDLLQGKDNRGNNGIAEDGSNEPGNQLGGTDLRWSWHLGSVNGALYTQIVGEDEAGGLPSRNIGLGGLEFAGQLGSTQSRLIIEGSNTSMQFNRDPHMYNGSYEHAIYTSGYRYNGRPLGAGTDNDSETYSLRGFHFLQNEHAIFWNLSRSSINRDGSNAPAPGGNIFGTAPIKETFAELGYKLPIGEKISLEFALTSYRTPLHFAGDTIDSGGYINLSSQW